MSGGGAAHRESERFCVDRLHEVAVGAGVDHFADALCIGKGRQCDDSQAVVGGSQLPDRLDTSDPGHHEVHHHDVGLEVGDDRQCSFARTGLADHLEVVEPGETGAHPFAQEVMVVDDDHGGSGHGSNRTRIEVPWPGALFTENTAPTACARSLMILSPRWPPGYLVRIEPGTVVGDAQFHGRSGNEADRQRPGIRMLGHVAERLLCDPVERDVDVRVETNRIESGGDVERAPALEGVEQMGDELSEVDVGQLIGP